MRTGHASRCLAAVEMAGLTLPQVGLKVALTEQTVKGKTRVNRYSIIEGMALYDNMQDLSIGPTLFCAGLSGSVMSRA